MCVRGIISFREVSFIRFFARVLLGGGGGAVIRMEEAVVEGSSMPAVTYIIHVYLHISYSWEKSRVTFLGGPGSFFVLLSVYFYCSLLLPPPA